jgi:indolepyruvate ferredoxin oxidoreductase alpha subunit
MGKDAARKTVRFIGDSTFIHSGITGLIDIVYNKGTSTVSHSGQFHYRHDGHQQNPPLASPSRRTHRQVDLVKLCQAVGVDRVRVCDPLI